jgi:hypothetical protein
MVRGNPMCVDSARSLRGMTSSLKTKKKSVWFVLVEEKAKLV